ncbi:MAG: PAS domain S-box protein [Actinomycetota bacterium]
MKPDDPSRQARDALHEAEARFHAAFQAAPIGMAILSLGGRFVQVNEALCRLIDRRAEDLLGTHWYDVTHPDDRPEQEEWERLAIAGESSEFEYEKRYIRPDGTRVWTIVSRSLVRDEDGEPLYFIAQILDISERKRVEAELSRQAEELSALHETTLDLIRRLEPTSLLETILSRAAALMRTEHGYIYVVDDAADELVVRVGIGLFSKYVGYHLRRGEGLAGRAWETGEPVAVADYHTWTGRQPEFEFIRAAVSVPLRAGHEIVGILGLVHLEDDRPFGEEDVDLLGRYARLASLALDNARLYSSAQEELRERRRAEKELERSADELRQANDELLAADEMKTHFVAVASHELRTPLTGVLGFARTLLSHWERLPDPERKEQIAHIEEQAARLSRLVDELLVMSRIDAGAVEVRVQPVDLPAAVHQAVAALDAAGAVDMAEVNGHVVNADPDHLQQILVNYLANALRHGAPPIRISSRARDGWVELLVEDRGRGVPTEFVPRLFQKFAQARGAEGGTGLGLSIVRGLARAQGGEVWYEPAAPGARFGVRLPSA